MLAIFLAAACAFPAFAAWKQENGEWHYYLNNGELLRNDFKQSGSSWFYLDENGNIAKNCEKIIGNFHYKFDENGNFVRSKLEEDGTLKYINGDYAMTVPQQRTSEAYNPYHNNAQVQWINATYAVLTKSNGGNIKAFGGQFLPSQLKNLNISDENTVRKIQENLKASWGVTDRASADQVLAALLGSAEANTSAWDYSRAMSNLGFYYLAGYYTIDEALDKALETAKKIQSSFVSWDAYNENYMTGYCAWSGSDGKERREVIEGLKGSAFNPYAVDWNLTLKKTW